MHRTLSLLALALIVQLALAAALRFGGPDLQAAPPDSALLTFDPDRADRLTIDDGDGNGVELRRENGQWRLTDPEGFPADGERVGQLLARLTALRQGPPVATSSGALERFRVADDGFEQRIRVAAGDETLATLLLGSSASVRQTYARGARGDAVVTVDFATHEAPARPAAWEDKALLAVPMEDIASIRIGSLTLNHHAEGDAPGWQAEGLAAHETLAEGAAAALAEQLARLRFGEVLRERSVDETVEPALALELTRRSGERVDYRLIGDGDAGDYLLSTSTRAERYTLPGYSAEPLIEAARRQALITVTATEAGASTETGTPPPAPAQ